jgi:hypothetical protein
VSVMGISRHGSAPGHVYLRRVSSLAQTPKIALHFAVY